MKRYKHVGTAPIEVAGKERQPGDEFSAALSDEDEKNFFEIGALKAVKKKSGKAKGKR